MHSAASGRLVFALSCVVAALIATALWLTGLAETIDERLRIEREALQTRPASGQVHLAVVDAKSIVALKNWPWQRQTHAALVDRLREAGAATIAFDIDFSTPSTSEGDAAFAAALSRAGNGVILPTFRQQSRDGVDFENLPIPTLRQHSILASVNVTPDPDGIMRTFTYGTVTAGVVRPAMPAMLAGAANTIGGSFPINTSIAPETLAVHSISDILAGKIGRETLAGKTVLIGATAIELGDRYALPRHGVQPGVVIQALATETLLQGLVFPNYGAAVPLMLSFFTLGVVALYPRRGVILAIFGLMPIAGLPLALEWQAIATVDVAVALGGYIAGAITLLGVRAAAEYGKARLVDAATGLPNEVALLRVLKTANCGILVVMRIRNFDEIVHAMSQDQRKILLDQVCSRVALAAGNVNQFSLGYGRIAWLSHDDNIDRLTERLEGLATLFASRIATGSQKVIVSPAFGIARGTDRANPVHADLAASRAAASGCRWVIYSAELASVTGRTQQLLADLDDAMTAGDISLVYQPKLTISTGRIEGVEALVRWNHPVIGPIPPDHFIPILEDAGRMGDLTLYIADQCIGLIGQWHKTGLETGIAVNISAPLFSDQEFVAALFARAVAMGSLSSFLTLEITESAVVVNDVPTIAALSMFRGAGVRIAIDDYGTGQSTLSYLKKFRADEIKIDKSFVRNLADEASDRILVRSTIAMAHEMGFKVVAEGVEDEACYAVLREFGCDIAQGWHIGRGLPIEDIEPKLRQNRVGLVTEAMGSNVVLDAPLHPPVSNMRNAA